MTRENISMFVVQNQDNFDSTQLPIITQQLERMDDSQLMIVSGAGYKNPTVSLILSIFLGYLGIDRFYIGDVGMGVLKLLTVGGFGILAIIDWFLIMGKTREKNYEKFMQISSVAPQSFGGQPNYYPNSAYPNGGYPNGGYQNGGYPNSGYQNGGQQQSYYPNNGNPAQNSAYPNGGYQSGYPQQNQNQNQNPGSYQK